MTNDNRVRRALEGDRSLMIDRAVMLDDISIRSGGDGRTVVAYAAIFNHPTQIVDQDGEYDEQIARTAFDKSLAERRDRIFSVYHHAKTLHGTPSDMGSIPIGRTVDVKPDSKGLLTVTRMNEGQWGDSILEAIKNGSLRGMSFTGVFVRSTPQLRPGQLYRPDSRTGARTLVTRQEIALIEYGPTPIPAYPGAEVVGVRSKEAGQVADDDQKQRESVTLTGQRAAGDSELDFPPGTSDAAAPYQRGDDTVMCPSCGKFNATDAVFCDQCGTQLPDSAFTGGRTPYTRDDGEDVQCPVDGLYNDADARYCDQCGAQLPDSAYHMTSSSGRRDDEDSRERAGSVDDSPWDASKAWAAGAKADDPAAFYAGICAGEKTTGDPKTQAHWALPYKYTPSSPPNAAGVQAALGRVDQTDDLKDQAGTKAKLEKLSASIHGGSDDDSKPSGRSADQPETATAGDTTSTDEGHGTGDPPAAAGQAEPPPEHSDTATEPQDRSRTMPDDRVVMTVEERAARQDAIRERLQEIDQEFTGAALPEQARSEWEGLQAELVTNDQAIRDASARAQYLETLAANPNAQVPGYDQGAAGNGGAVASPPSFGSGRAISLPGQRDQGVRWRAAGYSGLTHDRITNLYDVTEVRKNARSLDEMGGMLRDRALRSLEQATFPGEHTRSRETVQEHVEMLLLHRDDAQGSLAQRMLLTGSPQYNRAFGKAMANLSVVGLSTEEQRALAMGTPASFDSGSYPVPYQLDPTVTLTSNGAINQIRQIARVEQIVGKEWLGVTSAGITVSRELEATEETDAAPTLVQPGVAPTRVSAFVPFSIEVEQDWNGLMAEVAAMLADAKDVEESSSFALGNGTAPNAAGVVTTLATTSYVLTAATAAIAIGDLYGLEDAIPPRFRAQASWLGAKTTYNAIRQLFTQEASAAGDPWVRPSAGQPAEFLGYGAYENSSMSTEVTTSAQLVLLFGDFKQFIIVDRIGMSVELIPHLFGTTGNFPTGQRGIFAMWRNNSAVLTSNAFRLLKIK